MRLIICSIFILFLVVMTSCSGGKSPIPVIPSDESQRTLPSEIPSPPVFVSDYDSSGYPVAGMGVLGLFAGYIDLDTLQGELISIRKTTLTDTLEVVDITNFLTLYPCTDCIDLKSISIDAYGHPVATIGIKHPFDVGDPLKPITGRNRADLHVFNVEGIIVVDSPNVVAFPSLGESISDAGLSNADGYTGYLDPYLDDILPTYASLHPYILHFDDYSTGNFDPSNPMGFDCVTIPPPSGNLVMAMGCDYDYKDYIFDIDEGSRVNFLFAVGCTYGVGANTKANRFSPEYRIPQHNKKAASEVWVNIASNDLKGGDISSSAELDIFVLDMNHGAGVGGALDQMAFDSSVSNILVDIPGITSGSVDDYVAMGGNGRDPANPLLFKITITNASGGDNGIYRGLVKVLDSYPTGQNSSPLLTGKDGIKRVDPLSNPLMGTFDIEEFATYAAFEIEVSRTPQNPIAIIKTIPNPPVVTKQRPLVEFDGSDSYDPDGGPITLFEWDFDWDGNIMNFVPDVSSAQPTTEYIYPCLPGTHTAALRVTDDDTPAGVSSIASVQVTITDDFTPGNWTDPINLGAEFIQGDFLYVTGQMLNMESNGLVHIITYDYTPITYENHIYHRTFDGTNLSTRETVPGTPSRLIMVTSAIDGDDELHVVWITGWGVNMKIQHTCTQNGVFTGAVDDFKVNTQANYLMEMMNISSNSAGDIMVTWLYHDVDFTDVHFEYTFNEGSGFIPVTQIPYFINLRNTSDPSPSYTNVSPNLVSTPDNKFHQVYYANEADLSYERKIYDLVYNGLSWDAPRVAYDHPTTGAIMYDISVCAGPYGDIHITGESDLYFNMGYVRYDVASDTWLDYINTASNPNYAPYGAVEVDPYGMVHMVYKASYIGPPEYGFLHLKVFCEYCDEATILAIPDSPIDTTTLNSKQCHIDLMWDKDGNLLALYQDDREVFVTNTYFSRLIYN